jgi:hypothetical protein
LRDGLFHPSPLSRHERIIQPCGHWTWRCPEGAVALPPAAAVGLTSSLCGPSSSSPAMEPGRTPRRQRRCHCGARCSGLTVVACRACGRLLGTLPPQAAEPCAAMPSCIHFRARDDSDCHFFCGRGRRAAAGLSRPAPKARRGRGRPQRSACGGWSSVSNGSPIASLPCCRNATTTTEGLAAGTPAVTGEEELQFRLDEVRARSPPVPRPHPAALPPNCHYWLPVTTVYMLPADAPRCLNGQTA